MSKHSKLGNALLKVAIHLNYFRENYRWSDDNIRTHLYGKICEFEEHIVQYDDVFVDHLVNLVHKVDLEIAMDKSDNGLSVMSMPKEWENWSLNTCLQNVFSKYKRYKYQPKARRHQAKVCFYLLFVNIHTCNYLHCSPFRPYPCRKSVGD